MNRSGMPWVLEPCGPSRVPCARVRASAARVRREISRRSQGAKVASRFTLASPAGRDGSGLQSSATSAQPLERVRHWRATDVYEADEPLSAYHAREMAWCAASQLKSFGDCRFRFFDGILPRCSLCPLFDVERAIWDIRGEDPIPPVVLEISFGSGLRALFRGQLESLTQGCEQEWQVPDFPPEEWGKPQADEPPA